MIRILFEMVDVTWMTRGLSQVVTPVEVFWFQSFLLNAFRWDLNNRLVTWDLPPHPSPKFEKGWGWQYWISGNTVLMWGLAENYHLYHFFDFSINYWEMKQCRNSWEAFWSMLQITDMQQNLLCPLSWLTFGISIGFSTLFFYICYIYLKM